MIYVLAWVIGICNPLSALLVGPWLAKRVRRGRLLQGLGWALLACSQLAFLALGFASQLDGFRYAQPLMIPLALMNFATWFQARKTIMPQPLRVPDPSKYTARQRAEIARLVAEFQRDSTTGPVHATLMRMEEQGYLRAAIDSTPREGVK